MLIVRVPKSELGRSRFQTETQAIEAFIFIGFSRIAGQLFPALGNKPNLQMRPRDASYQCKFLIWLEHQQVSALACHV